MPGTDPMEAARIVAGELPELPHLVELPARGVGADLIGRAVGVMVDIPAEVVPSGWRLSRRPGIDTRRAVDMLAWDLDAAEAAFAGAPGLKVQVCGPWSLAASLELPSGNRAVTDDGAVDDLAASLTEGLRLHVAELRRRLGDLPIVVQFDEPSLPAVLGGRLPTASGFGTHRPVEPQRVSEVLAAVLAPLAGHPTVAHCCARDVPITLLREAGFEAISLDVTALRTGAAALDPLGEAIEAGTVLLAGLVPSVRPAPASLSAPRGPGASSDAVRPGDGGTADGDADGAAPVPLRPLAAPLLAIWDRLGFRRQDLAQRVVPTPTCGLAGASPAWARTALGRVRELARALQELPESW
ncbi:uroporphyrinogen decarboxylase/cobalamine-independent methonine synthase family protein [Nakamurella leprariae]|uniref:Methionine synthase n=1 Tax=Nakamurella leprariae TaxID=2803911 RepID=A0A939BX41_9ACTN|nr:methionine synthase [Nakamurella leprariae]